MQVKRMIRPSANRLRKKESNRIKCDQYIKILVRSFRQTIKGMFYEQDKGRSYHLVPDSRRRRIMDFFLDKSLFPFDELTQDYYLSKEQQFYLLVHNTKDLVDGQPQAEYAEYS